MDYAIFPIYNRIEKIFSKGLNNEITKGTSCSSVLCLDSWFVLYYFMVFQQSQSLKKYSKYLCLDSSLHWSSVSYSCLSYKLALVTKGLPCLNLYLLLWKGARHLMHIIRSNLFKIFQNDYRSSNIIYMLYSHINVRSYCSDTIHPTLSMVGSLQTVTILLDLSHCPSNKVYSRKSSNMSEPVSYVG